MKFKTDKCPICQTDLDVIPNSNGTTLFRCPFGQRQRNSETYGSLTMPKSHTYEVSTGDSNSVQIIDIPPFALDSISNQKGEYTSTIYKWSKNRPDFDNEPGWIEIGEYPFIEINGFKEGIKKLKRLLVFL